MYRGWVKFANGESKKKLPMHKFFTNFTDIFYQSMYKHLQTFTKIYHGILYFLLFIEKWYKL